jgi:capsular exopolysaccharide synthesis family protein
VLAERWWLLVLCLGAGVGWAIHQDRQQIPEYQAGATLLLDESEQQIVKLDMLRQEDLHSQETVNTIIQSIQQRAIIERVIEVNHLLDDPRFALPGGGGMTREAAVARISEDVSIRTRRGTRLIDVTMKHTNAEMAALIANALTHGYVRTDIEHQSRVSDGAVSFLMTEADRLKRKLHESEAALASYREVNGSGSQEQRQEVVSLKLRELNQKVTQARAERIQLEAELDQLQGLGTDVAALVSHACVGRDETVKALSEALTKAEVDFITVQQRYRGKHPRYLQAADQVQRIKARHEAAILHVPGLLAAKREKDLATEQALEKALREQEGAALQLNRAGFDYNVLAQEVEMDRALYQSIMNRSKEASLTGHLTESRVRVVQDALTPNAPLPSGRRMRWSTTLFCSAFIGVLLVFGLDSWSSRFRGVDEVERALQLPVFASIPNRRQARRSAFAGAGRRDAPIAEAFRSLRAAVQVERQSDAPRTILFTSSVEGEGKTFCAARYAVSVARQGLRTLVIDADLRRPGMERALYGRISETPGVMKMLAGRGKLSEVIRPTEAENLFCLSSGALGPNPAELLAGKAFKALLDEAVKEFDCVVVDSPPLHAVGDTFLLLDHVQAVSLVVRAHSTPRSAVIRAKNLLDRRGVTNLHVVLNRVRTGRLYRSYYYTYGNYAASAAQAA